MKWFFRIFLIIIGIIILIPLVIILLVMDGSKPPVDVYKAKESEGYSLDKAMSSAIDDFLVDAETKDLKINLTDDELNTIIYQMLQKSNPNYLIDDSKENQYFQKQGEQLGLVGVWTKAHKDGITIKARADLLQPIPFKSSVSLKFKLDFNVEGSVREMTLSLASAKIGSLSLPRSLVNTIATKAGIDLKGMVEPMLTANGITFGTFDAEKWQIKVDKIDLVRSQMTGESAPAINTLVKILTFNELLDVGLSKELLGAELKTTKLYFDKPLFVIPELLKIRTEAEKEVLLKGKTANFMLSALNSKEGELYVNLTELDINRLLDFYLSEQSLNKSINLGGKEYLINILVPTMEVKTGEIILNVKLELVDKLDPTSKFVTTMQVEIVPVSSHHDLQFELGKLTIGQDVELSSEETEDLLEMFGASEAINQNMLVINNFLLSFTTDKIKAKGSETHDGYLKLIYETEDPTLTTINEIRDAIRTAVSQGAATSPTAQTLYDGIKDVPRPDLTEVDVYNFMLALESDLNETEAQNFRTAMLARLLFEVPSVAGLMP